MSADGNYIGIDVGAENIKALTLVVRSGRMRKKEARLVEHHKDPRRACAALLDKLDLAGSRGGAATGRLARVSGLSRTPLPAAMASGFIFMHPEAVPATVIDIGGHGFRVLEIRGRDRHVYRESGRCSQGTGNFLRQLVGRFGITPSQADRLCAEVQNPAPLSGRCPVILKTDMTHLANKGESKENILAGLFDALAENVEVRIKSGSAPRDVFLSGGVSRSLRVQNHIDAYLASRGMRLHRPDGDEGLFYGAAGAALEAYHLGLRLPPAHASKRDSEQARFDRIQPLHEYLKRVKACPAPDAPVSLNGRNVILGFDMGSTGSKATALDPETRHICWSRFRRTRGDPLTAAKRLVGDFLEEGGLNAEVKAIGTTGSGREIVGSLFISCFGKDRVFILNEIAAHAEGALYYDRNVDTIFEIGGQDAKYIRLSGGRVYDSAMNEACSAGTGSFIEEQGVRFDGIEGIAELDERAIAADYGVSLGQHCSVFMAEVIDRALSAGVPRDALVAGIYDSTICNYLNRVKGSRSIGERIFCQGMPFLSRALAAAVARQTGRDVIIPPNPGFVGALGISLLTAKNRDAGRGRLDMAQFVDASLISRDSFVCKSTSGCGGTGNRCRVERLQVSVAGGRQQHLWGGSCSLYEQTCAAARPLPDRSPDPLNERTALLREIIDEVTRPRNLQRVGMTDEFLLKGLFPFFATFVRELGFDPVVVTGAKQSLLKRGIEENNVPLCAPMQLYGGVLAEIAEEAPEHIFLPMLRDITRSGAEQHSTTCPLSQSSADIYYHILKGRRETRFHRPVIDMGRGNLTSKLFLRSLAAMAADFGVRSRSAWEDAYRKALNRQTRFDRTLKGIGERAVAFAEENDIVPVVILGRIYTIYNDVLNSNVPRLLRELGAIGIPVDCYPPDDERSVYKHIYWGYSRLNLRAASKVSRTCGHYSVFCSNYSCGPDSFNLHFYSHLMQGKPFAVIETDGHAGDAGTKTRLEAFLYCVATDKSRRSTGHRRPNQLTSLTAGGVSLHDVRRRNDILLIPRMGDDASFLAATFRGDGFRAEALPIPFERTLTLGRRYTSGKECLPAAVTLGGLLQRVGAAGNGDSFAFFLPTASGPCRFGMYSLFHRLVLKEHGYGDKVHLVSHHSSNYFSDVTPGLAIKAFASITAGDLLFDALLDARPAEKSKGTAQAAYEKWHACLVNELERAPSPHTTASILESVAGVFGVRNILARAAREFAKLKDKDARIPTIAVVGEIYVRLDPFSNDFIVSKLEQRGVRVKLAQVGEWLEYVDLVNRREIGKGRFPENGGPTVRKISTLVKNLVRTRLFQAVAPVMKWPSPAPVDLYLEEASRFIRPDLLGEAVLTLGNPLFEYRHGRIDGVVSVGPLECMPNKVAEAQFIHAAEESGIPCLTISLNGEPMDTEPLDNLVYEVKKRFQTERNCGITLRRRKTT